MPGTLESQLLGGLINGVRYYAILKSADSQLNWSSYSNVATFTAVTTITAVTDNDQAPEMVLGIPRPTPTSGRADVNLDLPKPMDVDAGVFDAQGRLVRTLERGTLAAGTHVLHWDGHVEGGGDAPSGVYWVRAAAGAIHKRVKLVVVR
jgi:flagellar hook assembly protein FlgD